MLKKEMMSKKELTKKIGIVFDEVESLLSVETLTSMLMEQLVGGEKVDGTFDACDDSSCKHGVCTHYDCSHGTCSDDGCQDLPKPTQEPTQKPTPSPAPTSKSLFI